MRGLRWRRRCLRGVAVPESSMAPVAELLGGPRASAGVHRWLMLQQQQQHRRQKSATCHTAMLELQRPANLD